MSTQDDSQDSSPKYDSHIVPAETAARQQREGEDFGHTPQVDEGETKTADGYTVDKEGLLNNYAIEPEMYINVPGDLREKAEQEAADKTHQLQELSEDEDGKLTTEYDRRNKGPGII